MSKTPRTDEALNAAQEDGCSLDTVSRLTNLCYDLEEETYLLKCRIEMLKRDVQRADNRLLAIVEGDG